MRFKEFFDLNEASVTPVAPVVRSKNVDTPPKQNPYVPDLDKKPKQPPKDNKEKPLVDLIAEKKKRKKKRKAKYAYGGYFYPGYAFAGDSSGDAGGGGDGGGGGGESMYESEAVDTAEEIKKFAKWACQKLSIKKPPKLHLSKNTKEAQTGHHTGRHVLGDDSVWIYIANRNLVDILRTVFHELVHWRQHELGKIKPNDSYPGSPIEAQADMLAGKYIKIYGKENNHVFQ